MLTLAKQILNEIENNPTVQENRKIGMRVAVGYMLDNVENKLFNLYVNKEEIILTEKNTDLVFQNFCVYFKYDHTSKEEERANKLSKIELLITL